MSNNIVEDVVRRKLAVKLKFEDRPNCKNCCQYQRLNKDRISEQSTQKA